MKKKTVKEIQKELDIKWGKDYYLLVGEYINSKTPTTFYCSKCKREVISNFYQIKTRGCPECGRKRRSEKTLSMNKGKALTKEKVKEKFEKWNVDNEWELLNISESENKNNGRFDLTVKCKECGFITTQGNQCIFKKNFYCKYCNGRHIPLQEARKRLEEKYNRNIKIIKYNGWTSKGTLKCEKHNNEFICSPKCSFTQVSGGCEYCDSENKSGENNWAWQRGKTIVFNYLRGCIDSWLYDSYQFYDNKCIITGESKDLVIHHFIKTFKTIVEETVEEFGLSYEVVKKEIQEFEQNSINSNMLKDLVNAVRRKHYAIGYGVPLTKDIHNEFHSKYGRINNTPDQLIEFAKDKRVNLKIENNKLVKCD